jgi:hypothetical protein
MTGNKLTNATEAIKETKSITEPEAVLRAALTVKNNTPEATFQGTLNCIKQHAHAETLNLEVFTVETDDEACAYYFLVREANGNDTISANQIRHVFTALSRVCQPNKATGPKFTPEDHPLANEIPLLQLAATGKRNALKQSLQPA